jgi:diadenosine tetraphosphate (Ap4A) HIT family hydrolase
VGIDGQQNHFSHLTAIERDRLSFPSQILVDRDLLSGRVLDFGCGWGKDVEVLAQRGVDIIGFDPHYRPIDLHGRKFDTILCIYVLNVLLPPEQAEVIMSIAHLLESGGRAYFAVRRDIKKSGFRQHYLHRQPTYQCNVKLPFRSIFTTEHCEIYEYTHYNDRDRQHGRYCLFCQPRRQLQIVTESATAYAIFDGYPVSKGHTLIIPKRHISNFFDLPFKEQSACWLMANKVRDILDRQFQPDGYNVGINIDRAGGQTMIHASLHVIPRYHGDLLNGRKGGIRRVRG